MVEADNLVSVLLLLGIVAGFLVRWSVLMKWVGGVEILGLPKFRGYRLIPRCCCLSILLNELQCMTTAVRRLDGSFYVHMRVHLRAHAGGSLFLGKQAYGSK